MKNPEIFKGKNFQDILEEIHTHAAKKRESIEKLTDTIADMIKTPAEAAILVPTVKELIDIGIKNDEHLVKIATIVQRLMTSDGASNIGAQGEWVLTQDDRDKLLKEAKEFTAEVDEDIEEISEKIESVKSKAKSF